MRKGKALLGPGVIAVIVCFTETWSCTHDPLLKNIPEICFERDVLPVFQINCANTACHDGNGESGLVLNNYVPISQALVPGQPYKSAIYRSVISTSPETRMPPDRPLTLENRTKIRLWIEQGAVPSKCADTTGTGIPDNYYNPLACFSRDILPVLLSKCGSTGCHDDITHKEGYIYTSYTSVMRSVIAGSPSNSILYRSITTTGAEDKMPPAGSPQLTIAEIDSIAAWIRYGAFNQNCGETCDTINPVTLSASIWPVIQSTCIGCHTGSAPGGGILLTSYNNVATVAGNGNLIKALKGNGVTKMPPGINLSACRIKTFEIWVNNGYPNN